MTYAQQRSFLLERVDDEARSAAPAVGRLLDEQGVPHPGRSVQERERGGGFGPPRGGGRDPDDSGAGPGPPPTSLPPGTYAERRDATGKVLGARVLS